MSLGIASLLMETRTSSCTQDTSVPTSGVAVFRHLLLKTFSTETHERGCGISQSCLYRSDLVRITLPLCMHTAINLKPPWPQPYQDILLVFHECADAVPGSQGGDSVW